MKSRTIFRVSVRSTVIARSVEVCGSECFADRENLEEITFESESSVDQLPENAFFRCWPLSRLLIIGASLGTVITIPFKTKTLSRFGAEPFALENYDNLAFTVVLSSSGAKCFSLRASR
jgi:hypothetical protein